MPSKKKPNVLLITFDSARADHFGFMGYKKNTSPFLDSLAKKGTCFTRAYATGPGSPQSFVGILTSTLPLDYGGYTYVDRPRVFISEVFQKAGYRTIGLHSAAYMSSFFGYDRGWDVFKYVTHTKGGVLSPGMVKGTTRAKILKFAADTHRRLKRIFPPLEWIFGFLERVAMFARKVVIDIKNPQNPFYTGEEMNREVMKAIPKKPEKPVFLWLHYMDIHGPFGFSLAEQGGWWNKFRYRLADVLAFLLGPYPFVNRIFRSIYVGIYDDSISYTDKRIKEIFEYLTSVGVVNDETVIAVTSDHGEEFFDNGELGHMPKLQNVNLQVPLIFYGPRRVPAGARNEPVSLIDIGPTLMHFAGVTPSPVFRGGNMFEKNDRFILSQIVDEESDLSHPVFWGAALLSDGYRIIHWRGKKMLFRAEDLADRENLYGKKPEVVRKLARQLKPYERISNPGERL